MNALLNKPQFKPHFSRSWLAPEVVQTSAMDCGPAALKCLLEGFGIGVSYGRLREACQTDVDGTSIDTLEALAAQAGLVAEQIILPEDHLLLPESAALPALVVLRTPGGAHFVVVWRRHGNFVQVMDPGTGRRWMRGDELRSELYRHRMPIPAADWHAWASAETFQRGLRRRLRDLGVSDGQAKQLLETALAADGWQRLAALDAATRMTQSIVASNGLARGHEAATVLASFFERAAFQADIIPESYWMVRTLPPDEEGREYVEMTGCVLVQVQGRVANPEAAETALQPELKAALREEPRRAGRNLWALLRQDGMFAPLVLLLALSLAAGGIIIEAMLFQGLFNFAAKLRLTEQRLGALAALTVFAAALLWLELPLAAGLWGAGRKLETRLRLAFLAKIPRLGDRYFQSRLISDMAERAHSVQALRALPLLGGQFVRQTFELALTCAGLIWLNPRGAWVALTATSIAVALPLLMQSRLTERDLRVRSHNGALSRFYLDAMLGLTAVRTHGAARALRREHEALLVEWTRASYGLLRVALSVEAIEALAGCGLAAWLLFDHLARGGAAGSALLLVYWSLNLPALGQELALIAQQYPAQRNITLRALEPLGALEEDGETERQDDGVSAAHQLTISSSPRPATLNFDNVTVLAGGHQILNEINLVIAGGEHVAIVGASGAGKSSLAGLLLGWHRAASGEVLVDGEPLRGARLAQLRAETAWVDPAVQLWNQSLLDNLRYGNGDESAICSPQSAIESADLRRVLERLPDGLQTALGEGGALVSGGEGQRVRLGRALLREGARLVILDEAFRGLERDRRRTMLARAREHWRAATLLCITHDVGETLDFHRVLVVENGRIIEDGDPRMLAAQPSSRYGSLLQAETELRAGVWADENWRRLRLDEGRVIEAHAPARAAALNEWRR